MTDTQARSEIQDKYEGKIEKILQKEACKRLTPAQAQAMLMYARGCKVAQIRKQLGICQKTLWNWMQNNDFQELLEQAREILFNAMLDQALDSVSDMMQVLIDIAQDENAAPRERVTAASRVVDVSVKARQISLEQELVDIKEKLDFVLSEIDHEPQTIDAIAVSEQN